MLGARRARRLVRATVYVDGARVHTLRGARALRRRIVLRGLHGPTVRIRIAGRDRRGRVVRGGRTFRLCR